MGSLRGEATRAFRLDVLLLGCGGMIGDDGEGLYAVARVEIGGSGTYGWQVRLQRRGVKYAKFFSDGNYEGPDGALEAALVWRDALLEELSKVARLRVSARSERNQSGVVGVSQVRVKASNGVEYEFWQAAWSSSPGVRKTVKFSVKRYGSELAFRLAVEARREAVGV